MVASADAVGTPRVDGDGAVATWRLRSPRGTPFPPNAWTRRRRPSTASSRSSPRASASARSSTTFPAHARVSEPALPLVLAALHATLARPLVCLLAEDEEARDVAEAVGWYVDPRHGRAPAEPRRRVRLRPRAAGAPRGRAGARARRPRGGRARLRLARARGGACRPSVRARRRRLAVGDDRARRARRGARARRATSASSASRSVGRSRFAAASSTSSRARDASRSASSSSATRSSRCGRSRRSRSARCTRSTRRRSTRRASAVATVELAATRRRRRRSDASRSSTARPTSSGSRRRRRGLWEEEALERTGLDGGATRPAPALAAARVRGAASGDRGARARRGGERARRDAAAGAARRRRVPAPGRGAAHAAPAPEGRGDRRRARRRARPDDPSLAFVVSPRDAASSGATSGVALLPDTQVFRKRPPRADARLGRALQSFADLRVGDYVVHEDHGVGRLLGFETKDVAGVTRDYLFLAFRGEDRLYVPHEQIGKVSRYIGADAKAPSLSKLGGKAWQNLKSRARASVRELAGELLALYARAGRRRVRRSTSTNDWLERLEARSRTARPRISCRRSRR